jgi:hypothetical protein
MNHLTWPDVAGIFVVFSFISLFFYTMVRYLEGPKEKK